MLLDFSVVYINSAHTMRYSNNTSELQVIELLESRIQIIKSRKMITFFKKFACSNYYSVRINRRYTVIQVFFSDADEDQMATVQFASCSCW